jgi:hypothetical protein
MPTLEYLSQIEKEALVEYERRNMYLNKLKANETPEQKEILKKLGIKWAKDLPILECKWNIDYCAYDGLDLREISTPMRSTVIGNTQMGPGFIVYSIIKTLDRGEHFEQCSSCNRIYLMGPSPQELEIIRKHKHPEYRAR